MILTTTFSAAVARAAEWHAGHTRKGGDTPYLAHLLGVTSLVLEAGGDETIAIAAMLHDAVEDRPDLASFESIEREFGGRVSGIVRACTDSTEGGSRDADDWDARKAAYVAHLRETDDHGVLLVSCCDKIHNARTIERDLRVHGDALWERFNAPKPKQLAHYRALADAFLDRIEEPGWLPAELDRVVRRIEEIARGD